MNKINKGMHKRVYALFFAASVIGFHNTHAVEKGELKSTKEFRNKLSDHDMSVVFFYSSSDKSAKRNLKSFADVSNKNKYDDAGVAFFQVDINEEKSNMLNDLGVSGSIPVIVLFRGDSLVKDAVLRESFTKKSISSFIDSNFGDDIDEATDSQDAPERTVVERRYYYYSGYDNYPYWGLGLGFGLGYGLGYGYGGWGNGWNHRGGGHWHGGGGHGHGRHGGGGHHGGHRGGGHGGGRGRR